MVYDFCLLLGITSFSLKLRDRKWGDWIGHLYGRFYDYNTVWFLIIVLFFWRFSCLFWRTTNFEMVDGLKYLNLSLKSLINFKSSLSGILFSNILKICSTSMYLLLKWVLKWHDSYQNQSIQLCDVHLEASWLLQGCKLLLSTALREMLRFFYAILTLGST